MRRGNGKNFAFPALNSWLIPHEFAETKSAAVNRRRFNTRQAHKAREKRLDELLSGFGIPVLKGRRSFRNGEGKWDAADGDEKLEREFPEKGDDTCYTSCLLRILLIQGEALEPWQIYKALHSAIQRRGYDDDIAWKHKERASDDEGVTQLSVSQFQRELERMAPGQPEYHFPCYYDAYQMGLWSPGRPQKIKLRQDHNARRARGYIPSRDHVEGEFRKLIEGAAKQFPELTDKAGYILFGPAEVPYASYDRKLRKAHKLKMGTEDDWLGVMGQKIPRFDNRIISKCAVMPRFNVCKIKPWSDIKTDPKQRLPHEVTFLMKLKNMRFQDYQKRESSLSHVHLKQLLEGKHGKTLSLESKQWETYLEKEGLGIPSGGQVTVKKPKGSGRSSYCRPALEIIKDLLLSGKSPAECYDAALEHRVAGNTDPKKGLVAEDLSFLKRLADEGVSWEGFYLPNQKLEVLSSTSGDPDVAIRRLIGEQNDPIVRHRLTVFKNRLDALEAEFGSPDAVVLEFVREDFMGKKAKERLNGFQNDREKKRLKGAQRAKELGLGQKKNGWLIGQLFDEQGGKCLYTGDPLKATSPENWDIDHIVPRKQGGPDAQVNYVLTTRSTNEQKGDLTPYEWFQKENPETWDAYCNRVKQKASALSNKKVRLLTSPHAKDLVDKYTSLAETAWISKLSQTIIGLKFGWKNGVDQDGKRRVIVVSGQLTASIRERFGLDRILAPDETDPQEAKKKNRNDDRHHALDAMVISFIPGWMRDRRKHRYFKISGLDNPYPLFERNIAGVVPAQLCFKKSKLEETIYAKRRIGGEDKIVYRVDVRGLGLKTSQGEEFSEIHLRDAITREPDQRLVTLVNDWLNGGDLSQKSWTAFIKDLPLEVFSDQPEERKSLKEYVRKLGFRSKSTFDTKHLIKQSKKIMDDRIRETLQHWAGSERTEADWYAFCQDFRLPTKSGEPGPMIKKVAVLVGDPTEFKNLSKDPNDRGKYRKGAQHQGYWVYLDSGEKPRVRPVYAHASPHHVKKELVQEVGEKRLVDFFQSGCLIKLEKDLHYLTKKTDIVISAGTYILNTILASPSGSGRPKFNSKGKEYGPIALEYLLECGFSRVR